MTSTRPPLPLLGLRVLGISPTPTHPTIAGNRARYRALLDRLETLGAKVRLVHIGQEAGDLEAMRAHWSAGAAELPFAMPPERHWRWNRFARRSRRYLHLPLRHRNDVDDWCDATNLAAVRAEVTSFQPHAVLMLYFWNSLLLDGLAPNILKVLDAQDVFTDRNKRMEEAGIPMKWFSVPRQQEKRGLDRFDVIVAIQEHEAQFYRALTKRPVVTVGHLLAVASVGPPPVIPQLLIVASDNPINIDGVRWFLQDVWPGILTLRPDAMLRIVGRVCAHLAPSSHVLLEGALDDLLPVYAAASIVINPLRGGTGLKIKGAEALGAGRVVVSTPSAAVGLEEAIGHGLMVATDAHEMVAIIDGLLSDRDTLCKLSAAAALFAREWNDRFAQSFDAVFLPLVAGDDPDPPREPVQDLV